jgi:hypothetical protein
MRGRAPGGLAPSSEQHLTAHRGSEIVDDQAAEGSRDALSNWSCGLDPAGPAPRSETCRDIVPELIVELV